MILNVRSCFAADDLDSVLKMLKGVSSDTEQSSYPVVCWDGVL